MDRFPELKSREEFVTARSSGFVRRSGKSTAIVLEGLAKAMYSPGIDVPVRDHYTATPSVEAALRLAIIARGLVAKLGLEKIHVTRCDSLGCIQIRSEHYGIAAPSYGDPEPAEEAKA
jgi:hypothetical protein